MNKVISENEEAVLRALNDAANEAASKESPGDRPHRRIPGMTREEFNKVFGHFDPMERRGSSQLKTVGDGHRV